MTDWPVKTLGSICEVFDDGDWIESKDQAPTGVRLVQTGNVGEGVFKDRSDKARFISEATFTRLRCTEIIPGDLLVSRLPDPVGRACLIPDTGSKMITAVDCTIMRPRKEVMSPQFLVAATQTGSYREQVRAKITGTTRDRISRSNLAEVQVAVPPLEEQKRIVALLDAATASITELTACYNQARTHANNLFTSALRDALEGNPDWLSGALDYLCEVEYGTRVTRKRDGGTKYPVYGGGGATFNLDDFNRQDQMIVSRFAMSEECVRFVPGKFFLNDSGLTVRTRDEKLMTQEFLDQQLIARSTEIYATARGTAQKNMDMTMFRNMQLAYPESLEEQKRIVARLDSMRAKTSEMVAAYDAKLTAAKNLRQSILESAFAGEL